MSVCFAGGQVDDFTGASQIDQIWNVTSFELSLSGNLGDQAKVGTHEPQAGPTAFAIQ
jgi:hypothetical protein